MRDGVSRRAVLQAMFASFVVGLPLGTAACGDDDARGDTGPAHSRATMTVGSYFADAKLAAATEIGRRWLERVKPGATLDEQRALVGATLTVTDTSDSVEQAIVALRAQVQADFGAGGDAVDDVEGWTFALTELHLCVIAGLPGGL